MGLLTLVTMDELNTNMPIHTNNVKIFRLACKCLGHLSVSPVINDSTLQNSLSIPII